MIKLISGAKYHTSRYNVAGSNTLITNRKRQEIYVPATSLILRYANYYINSSLQDVVGANPITVQASIEYPVGTFTRLTFGGSSSKVLQPGDVINTDALSINLPKGAVTYIKTTVQCSSGQTWPSGYLLIPADGEGTFPAGTDYTMLAGVLNGDAQYGFCPVAVMGEVGSDTTASVCVFADSKIDSEDDLLRKAWLARMLDSLKIPYCNFAVKSFRAGLFKLPENRPGITACATGINFTHLIEGFSANDLQGGATVQGVYDDIIAVHDFARSLGINKISHTTCEPLAESSSDGFSTVAGQNMRFQNSMRAPLAQMFRDNTDVTVLEMADTVEVNALGNLQRAGGYWLPYATADGVHETTATHASIANNQALRTQVASFTAGEPVAIKQLIIPAYRQYYVSKDIETIPLWKTSFDNVISAKGVLNDSGEPAQDGEAVKNFVDQISGTLIPYMGVADPKLTHSKPRLYKNIGDFVFFANETGVWYGGSPATSVYPRERWFIVNQSNYQIYEAYFNQYYFDYFGDIGSIGFRTKQTADGQSDTAWFANVPLPLNQTFLIREKFTDDLGSDRISVEVWINGTKVNKTLNTYRNAQVAVGVGAETNNSHFGMRFIGYKNAHFTDDSAALLTAELMNEHRCGLPLEVPYVENMAVVKTGTVYTGSYTFKSVGSPILSFQSRWLIMPLGNPTVENYMPELDGLTTFDAANYPQYNIGIAPAVLRWEMIAVDQQNRKYMVPQSILINP